MSIAATPIAPILQFLWFYDDYWRPQYTQSVSIKGIPIGIEEALFAFFTGGVACIFYEVILRKRQICTTKKRRTKEILIVLGFAFFIAVIFKYFLHTNSIWATTIPMIISSILLVILDQDLIKDLLYSGIFLTFFILLVYFLWLQVFPDIFNQLWITESFSGISLLTIPIEEIAWFLGVGMFGGIAYEYWINVKTYKDL